MFSLRNKKHRPKNVTPSFLRTIMDTTINSFKKSNAFYKKLGAKGMAQQTSPQRNVAYVKFLEKLLPKNGRILDCACGYGRLTIPLAQKGFTIEGVDLSPSLILSAKNLAKEQNIAVTFKVGNMCKLPYQDAIFSALVCMWSSFNHLLTKKDQLHALNEMLRVLKPCGFILIDLPRPQSFTTERSSTGAFINDTKTLFKETFDGIENIIYFHNKKSLMKLLQELKNCSYSVRLGSIDTRKRLLVKIVKSEK